MPSLRVGDETPPLPCSRCGQPRVHEVLAVHATRGSICDCHPGERFEADELIGRCRSCGQVAFLSRQHSSIDAGAAGLEAVWFGYEAAWRFEVWGGEGDYADSPGVRTRPVTRFVVWNAGNQPAADEVLRRLGRHRPDVVVVKGGENISTQPLPAGLWDMGLAWQHIVPTEDGHTVRIAAKFFIEGAPPGHRLEVDPPSALDLRVNGVDVIIVLAERAPLDDIASQHGADPALIVSMSGAHGAQTALAPTGFIDLHGAFASPMLTKRVLDAYTSPSETADGISLHPPFIIDIQG